MRVSAMKAGLWAAAVVLGCGITARAAETYGIDQNHSGVNFKIQHSGISWIYGRFNDVDGEFTLDAENPSASSFSLTMKTESVDTANEKRDEHLRSPDFFNAKQFPVLSFQSKSVKKVDEGLEVTGDLTLHGETQPLTFLLKGGKSIELPKGTHRVGYTTHFKLKRSDFGMDTAMEFLGDDVHVEISFQGVRS